MPQARTRPRVETEHLRRSSVGVRLVWGGPADTDGQDTAAATENLIRYLEMEPGCMGIQPGQTICLSKGTAPMPSPVTGATCGPQVRGTVRPTNGTELANLNPCPLNVCCNIWGHCGLSADFCIESPADSGAPGAAKPGSNGCISNCGMNIINSSTPPSEFRTVGYFESWNKKRPCLNMDVSKLEFPAVSSIIGLSYTHIYTDHQCRGWT